MFDYRNNERCSRYQRGQTKDYAQIAELVERRAHDTLSAEAPCMLAVARKETNEMIGEIVVVPKDDTHFPINIIVMGTRSRLFRP